MYVIDIEHLVYNHRLIAEKKEGFMEDLSKTFYGTSSSNVLCWSLQDVISGVRVNSPTSITSAGAAAVGCSGGTGDADVVTAHTSASASSAVTSSIRTCVDDVNKAVKRRCQVRVHQVMIKDELFLYNSYEVRLPMWDEDLDGLLEYEYNLYNNNNNRNNSNGSSNDYNSSCKNIHIPQWTNSLENDYCGNGHARPYNEQRNKTETERYLLSELPELQGGCQEAVTSCVRGLFEKLKPVFVSRYHASKMVGPAGTHAEMSNVFDTTVILQSLRNPTSSSTSCATTTAAAAAARGIRNLTDAAIIGVDLVLTKENGEFSAHIVEINNNPAMPSSDGKKMSSKYRDHLSQLVGSMMHLAMLEMLPEDETARNSLMEHFVKL